MTKTHGITNQKQKTHHPLLENVAQVLKSLRPSFGLGLEVLDVGAAAHRLQKNNINEKRLRTSNGRTLHQKRVVKPQEAINGQNYETNERNQPVF